LAASISGLLTSTQQGVPGAYSVNSVTAISPRLVER
jgi:hypothetical protein